MDKLTKTVRRAELWGLLGDMPPLDRPVSVLSSSVEERGNYILERLVLDLNGIEPVPAYFVRPKGEMKKRPTVLFCHSHGGKYHLGKDELLQGNSYMPPPSYADDLTAAGYSALCIDSWVFGERAHWKESYAVKEMLWKGQTLWGMMIYDNIKAMDYLLSRDDVDGSRIASLGMSMGSTMSWWLAALDERIKVCADICCLTEFDALMRAGNVDDHGFFYFVPGLLKHFTAGEINALISPRPHISVDGLLDPLTPADGLQLLDEQISAAYAEEGAEGGFVLKTYEIHHHELPEMRRDVMQFLKERL